MNRSRLNFIVAATSVAFPLGLLAESSSPTSTLSAPSTTHSSTTADAAQSSGSDVTPASDTIRQDAAGATGGAAAALSSIRRVTQESLSQQFTAKALIGKDVYDSNGKKVGDVRDVVLDPSSNSMLATGLTQANSAPKSSGPSTSVPMSAVGASSTTSGSDVNSASNTSRTPSGPAAIVAIGSTLGMGGNLLQIPLSQLGYDSTHQHIRLNVAQSDLATLLIDPVPARNAAE